jgi:beta-phosphoglucomutase-like phosphatase (HAD superfamily)
MSLEGMIVGVDLDGVCADFYGRMREIAAEWFECRVEDLSKNVSYGLSEWGVDPAKYDSLHRFAVLQRGLFETSPMIPGARKYLRRLSDEGARIRIITHRLFVFYFHKAAVSQTVGWLDHHGIPYVDLCFMKEKEQVGANIYIEDAPKNVEALRLGGHKVICFGNSTNTHIGDPRATSWEEVYRLVLAQSIASNRHVSNLPTK